MADNDMKEYVSKKMHDTENHVKKQERIAKAYGYSVEEPHKYAKKHWANCGNSNCLACMNPRKSFKQKTIQEKSFDQTSKWREE